MVLVDGGVLNNLPADVLSDRGADFVVGVDVSSHIRAEFARNRPGMTRAQMKRPNAIETILRVFEVQAHGMGNVRNRAVDFWITPDTAQFSFTDFTRAPELAAAGEAAAHAVVPKLKQLLAELDVRVARESSP
jgi:predicted acylesterase/phospholipase RssA